MSAFEIGITPSSFDLRGDPGERICSEFKIFLSEDIDTEIELRLSEKESREVSDYSLSPEEKNIDFSYFEIGEIEGGKEFEFCLAGEFSGEYNALILSKVEEKNVAVGSWVRIEVGGNRKFIENTLSIISPSGLSVGISESQGSVLLNSLIVMQVILVLIVIALIYIWRKKKRREREKDV